MYHEFFNLTTEPFRLSPDHRFCFKHRSYGRAKTYMTYALDRMEGFVVVTGAPGTGKSTLIEDLFADLKDSPVVRAKLAVTQLEGDDLVRMVAYSFDINAAGLDKATLISRLTEVLVTHRHAGRRSLMVVDEAQDLSRSALEELRLLTNLQQDSIPLLQIFLVGQQELREIIRDKSMEQLQQRIIAACHLEPLKAAETRAYVVHRLVCAGWKGNPCISPAAFHIIHEFSQGVPRRINLLCSRLFLHGSVEERHQFLVADVQQVIQELAEEKLDPLGDVPGEITDLTADIPTGMSDRCTPSIRVTETMPKPDGAVSVRQDEAQSENLHGSDIIPTKPAKVPHGKARTSDFPAGKVAPRDADGEVDDSSDVPDRTAYGASARFTPAEQSVAGGQTRRRGRIYWAVVVFFTVALLASLIYALNGNYAWHIDPFAPIRAGADFVRGLLPR